MTYLEQQLISTIRQLKSEGFTFKKIGNTYYICWKTEQLAINRNDPKNIMSRAEIVKTQHFMKHFTY